MSSLYRHYRISGDLTFPSKSLSPSELLVLLGMARGLGTDRVGEAHPGGEAQVEGAIERLVAEGVLTPGEGVAQDGPGLDLDPKSPPTWLPEARPFLVDPDGLMSTCRDAHEYYLLSRIDGEVTVALLAELVSMPLGEVLTTVARHALEGHLFLCHGRGDGPGDPFSGWPPGLRKAARFLLKDPRTQDSLGRMVPSRWVPLPARPFTRFEGKLLAKSDGNSTIYGVADGLGLRLVPVLEGFLELFGRGAVRLGGGPMEERGPTSDHHDEPEVFVLTDEPAAAVQAAADRAPSPGGGPAPSPTGIPGLGDDVPSPSTPAAAQDREERSDTGLLPADFPLEGPLTKDRGTWWVKHHLRRFRATGRLVLSDGVHDRTIYYHNGIPIFAHSTAPDEDLARHMVSSGAIDQPTYETLVAELRSPGVDILQCAIDTGLVAGPDVCHELAVYVRRISKETDRLQEGVYSFAPLDPAAMSILQDFSERRRTSMLQRLRQGGRGKERMGPRGAPRTTTRSPAGASRLRQVPHTTDRAPTRRPSPGGGDRDAKAKADEARARLSARRTTTRGPVRSPAAEPVARPRPTARVTTNEPRLTPSQAAKAERSNSARMRLQSRKPPEPAPPASPATTNDSTTGEGPASGPKPPTKIPQERPLPEDPHAFIQAHQHHFVCMSPEQEAQARKLKLGDRERRLIEPMSRSTLRVRELIPMSSLHPSDTERFIVGMYAKGLIDLSKDKPSGAQEVETLEQLQRKLDEVKDADHFEALGLHPTATGDDIEQAYQALMEQYGEKKFSGKPPELQDLARRLRSRYRTAYAAIKSSEARRAYREETFGKWKVQWYGDFQFKKGDELLSLRSDIDEAVKYLASAHDLVPSNGLYLATLAYARFLQAGKSRKAESEARSKIEKAIRIGKDDPYIYGMAARFELDARAPDVAIKYVKKAQKASKSPSQFKEILATYKLKAIGG